ncbi:MAG: HEAT repeat domain-containing protein [Verrucomicrobiota bacterium]
MNPTPQRLTILVIVLAATVAAGIVVLWPPYEYQGRTVSEWLSDLRGGGPSSDRERAQDAFRAMGSEALPGLREVLRERPDSLRARLRGWVRKSRLMKEPAIDPSELRRCAMQAALFLGKDAGVDTSRLVPLLSAQYAQIDYVETGSARALAWAGPSGIAALTNFLRTGEPGRRQGAGWALSIDPETRRRPGVQEALIRGALEDPDPKVRADLVLYLSLFGPDGDASRLVPVGIRFLSDTNAQARWMGAKLLSSQAQSPDARIALERALHDTVDQVRSTAQEALKRPALVPR